MNNTQKNIAYLLLLLIGCTYPFETNDVPFERSVVVSGTFTDEYTRHEITLSYSAPIENVRADYVENASVWIVENGSNRIDFLEISPGIYQTTDSVAGQSGASYQLFFTTSEGRNYSSSENTLQASPEITDIKSTYRTSFSSTTDDPVGGIQFLVDTEREENAGEFFRYEYREDFLILAPFESRFRLIIINDTLDSLAPRVEDIHICYGDDESDNIILANASLTSGPTISDIPITYVPETVGKLRHRYALTVSQYAINADAYTYYENIKNGLESGGSLFETQQGTLAGNIVCLDDPSETVLGYFEVSGSSSYREFFDFEDLDPRLSEPPSGCTPDDIILVHRDTLRMNMGRLIMYQISPDSAYYAMTRLGCADCTISASSQPPSYWTDED